VASGRGKPGDQHAARTRLIETISREIETYGLGDGTRQLDPRVRAAMAKVPRERFVPAGSSEAAYDNRPLDIGHRQTISQPLIVAAMTQLLRIGPDAHVLEVGTGSGYQTAVLAELAAEVSTVEIVEPLAADARQVLAELGYDNIAFRCGDGAAGWPERAPFDGIIVTAAAPEIPQALVDQLKPGGRLVIPVGPVPCGQDLLLVEKDAKDRVRERRLFSVAFVPLTGDAQALAP
jgi:protein-L-isoaspartate(D-aspartate) O-methyltransferase